MALDLVSPSKTCTVSGPLGYVLRVSQILGIAPLNFTKIGTGWRIRVSPLLNICSKIFVTALCLLFVIILVLMGERLISNGINVEKNDIANKALYFSNTGIAMIFILYTVYFGGRRMQGCIDCINAVEELQNKISNEYQHVPQIKKMHWKLPLFSILMGIVATFWDTTQVIIFDSNYTLGYLVVFEQLLIMFFFCIRVVAQAQFIIIVKTVVLAFVRLNDCLKHLQINMKQTNGVKQHSKPMPEAIREMVTYHGNLCDVVKHVDEIHGFQLLLSLTINLLCLLTTTYFIILGIVLTEANFNSYKISSHFIWFIVHLSNLLAVIEPCHDTYEEVEVTKITVTKMMLIAVLQNEDIYKAVDRFYKHLILANVAYTPMNIFTLNRPLLVTIFSAITTYLVIVLQNRQ